MHVSTRRWSNPKPDAIVYRTRRQRGDDGLQAAVDHNGAIDESGGEAHKENGKAAQQPLADCADDDCGGQAVCHHEDHPDGKIKPAGEHRKGLRHGDERQQNGLVGGGRGNGGVEARFVVADVDAKHQHEEAYRRERAEVM